MGALTHSQKTKTKSTPNPKHSISLPVCTRSWILLHSSQASHHALWESFLSLCKCLSMGLRQLPKSKGSFSPLKTGQIPLLGNPNGKPPREGDSGKCGSQLNQVNTERLGVHSYPFIANGSLKCDAQRMILSISVPGLIRYPYRKKQIMILSSDHKHSISDGLKI